jgi:DNA-binding beta-propeller fold protein YncE
LEQRCRGIAKRLLPDQRCLSGLPEEKESPMKQLACCLNPVASSIQRRSSRRGAFALPVGLALGALALSGSHLPSAAASPPLAPGTLITVAGTSHAGFSGDGGPATEAALSTPGFIAADAAGDLYAADLDNHRVRRISASGIITTVAGSGQDTFSGDGGPATKAGMNPVTVAVDSTGNLYIVDAGNNNRIRKVDASGIITTVAGGGHPADGIGDGGPATSARLNFPTDVALDARGNLFIVEHTGHRVRMVTPAGTISTVAGTGQAGFAGDGGPATAAQLNLPISVVPDDAGHLYIADVGNHRVRMVGPDGAIRTVAGGGNPVDGLGDGGLATEARLDTPMQLVLDGAGNLFVADSRDLRIRRVGPVGIINTVAGTGKAGFAGDGGPATQALLSGPWGLAMDMAGNLYFSDAGRFMLPSNLEPGGNQRIREVVGVGVPR